MLRETRERYGLTLRDVANALRIRVVYLHALEEGRFADLPGRPYVVGFLRSYAEYFSLDGDQVVRHYREERADGGSKGKLVFPEPPPETKFPVAAMLAILVVVSIVGYGGWQLIGGGSSDNRPMVASVPTGMAIESDLAEAPITLGEADGFGAGESLDGATLAMAEPAMQASSTTRSLVVRDAQLGAEGAVGQSGAPIDPKDVDQVFVEPEVEETGPMLDFSSASAASMPGDEAQHYASNVAQSLDASTAPSPSLDPSLLGFPNAGEAIVPGDLSSLDPNAPVGASPVEISAIEAAATQIFGDVNTDARVILRTTADCWIQITDGQGSEVFTRLMKAGDIYKVPNRGDLLLRMGNAGGLEVIVDGTPLPLLGAAGEVKRNVSLDPTALQASL